MRVTDCRYLTGATRRADYPRNGLPEVAFLGRSNVGKSSLINALIGRKAARVSRTPGRTQQAHFFGLNGAVVFVDLPGYGYAKAPAKVRDGLIDIIESYMTAPRPLALALLLVDSRHEPSELDTRMSGWLEQSGAPVQVVATKIDKLSGSQRGAALSRLEKGLRRERIIPFSSETGEGKKELWQAIDDRIESLRSRAPVFPIGGPTR